MKHRRAIYYLLFLSVALNLAVLPLVVLPDIAGAAASDEGRAMLTPFVMLLLQPVEMVWHAAGQFGTLDNVDCAAAPCVPWGRPPMFFRIALRHSSLAVPFWWFVQIVLFEVATRVRARFAVVRSARVR